ncbi:hypothetical protein COCC4DRAFT_29992, partial [Bipolaris maydis ATCC 48331]
MYLVSPIIRSESHRKKKLHHQRDMGYAWLITPWKRKMRIRCPELPPGFCYLTLRTAG